MVPVRFISEGLGAEVAWDGNTKTVTITMDSIDYLKLQVENLQKELSKKMTKLLKRMTKLKNCRPKLITLKTKKLK